MHISSKNTSVIELKLNKFWVCEVTEKPIHRHIVLVSSELLYIIVFNKMKREETFWFITLLWIKDRECLFIELYICGKDFSQQIVSQFLMFRRKNGFKRDGSR